jgi:hypothetical protein
VSRVIKSVFTVPLPSTGHDADHLENIRYYCEVFSARCVVTSAARTAEKTAPILLAACLLERVYLATGFAGSMPECFEQIRHDMFRG